MITRFVDILWLKGRGGLSGLPKLPIGRNSGSVPERGRLTANHRLQARWSDRYVMGRAGQEVKGWSNGTESTTSHLTIQTARQGFPLPGLPARRKSEVSARRAGRGVNLNTKPGQIFWGHVAAMELRTCRAGRSGAILSDATPGHKCLSLAIKSQAEKVHGLRRAFLVRHLEAQKRPGPAPHCWPAPGD